VRNLCRIGKQLLSDYRAKEGRTVPDLNQTEVIWRDFERLNRKYWSITYADLQAGKWIKDIPAWDVLEQ